MPAALRLRPARPDEAGRLGDIMRTAKQSHGYDETFMAQLTDAGDFNIEPDLIARNQFQVAEMNGRVVGFVHLMPVAQPGMIYLEHLFIEPDVQGLGVGRALFAWALDEARAQGYAWLEWDSDPNAAPFYEKMGGEQISTTESTLVEGRMIPKFRMPTTAQ